MSLQKPDERLLLLAEKWLNGTITPEEKSEFDLWYNSFDDKAYEPKSSEGEVRLRERLKDQLLAQAHIVSQRTPNEPGRYFWLGLAASLILVATMAVYFLKNNHAPAQPALAKQELMPGGNKAVLTLASGRKIILNDAASGHIAHEAGVTVSKTADGKVIYDRPDTAIAGAKAVTYNILTTPRGGQYQLTLADGTKVWLNAASSIKFPAVFNGTSREVEITGEAYFEVAHNAAKPFRVMTGNQQVEVLGTHFDVNAYADEPTVKTTLFQGSVKVTDEDHTAVLKPGEQAQLKMLAGVASIAVNTPQDMDEVIAWKNGLFEFNQADVASIMRQVARWYDVEIIYPNKISGKTFSGSISRQVNASQLLDILSYSGLHFKIDGKKIIVTP